MPSTKYRVYDISYALSSGGFALEYLGGKPKGWFFYNIKGEDVPVLFKKGRPGTGENWAEKVTCELAKILDLPHATYELANIGKDQCVISPNFLKEDEELRLGNQLIEGFDKNQRFKYTKHTLNAILSSLKRYNVEIPLSMANQKNDIKNAQDLFVGYMCFDAWIGNTDRHAENWGIITKADHPNVLAPTFDHASSLGRNESDERRQERLQTKDTGYNVSAYVQRAKAPIYNEEGQQLNMLSLVAECKKYAPVVTEFWIEKISEFMVHDGKIKEIFYRIPDEFITESAREFAMAMLEESITRLRELQK